MCLEDIDNTVISAAAFAHVDHYAFLPNSLPVPPVISALEYAHLVVLLITILLAWNVYRGSARGRPSGRDGSLQV